MPKGPTETHVKGHGGTVDCARVLLMLVGDVKLSWWCGHAATSGGELSGEGYSSLPVEVQPLFFKIHHDVSVVGGEGRGSVKCRHDAKACRQVVLVFCVSYCGIRGGPGTFLRCNAQSYGPQRQTKLANQ
jgi:hypothetical protein